MNNFNWNFTQARIPGKWVSVRQCIDEVGAWVHLFGVVLTALMVPTVGGIIPYTGKSGMCQSREPSEHKQPYISSLLSILHCWVCCDQGLQVAAHFPFSCFLSVFNQTKGKEVGLSRKFPGKQFLYSVQYSVWTHITIITPYLPEMVSFRRSLRRSLDNEAPRSNHPKPMTWCLASFEKLNKI